MQGGEEGVQKLKMELQVEKVREANRCRLQGKGRRYRSFLFGKVVQMGGNQQRLVSGEKAGWSRGSHALETKHRGGVGGWGGEGEKQGRRGEAACWRGQDG